MSWRGSSSPPSRRPPVAPGRSPTTRLRTATAWVMTQTPYRMSTTRWERLQLDQTWAAFPRRAPSARTAASAPRGTRQSRCSTMCRHVASAAPCVRSCQLRLCACFVRPCLRRCVHKPGPMHISDRRAEASGSPPPLARGGGGKKGNGHKRARGAPTHKLASWALTPTERPPAAALMPGGRWRCAGEGAWPPALAERMRSRNGHRSWQRTRLFVTPGTTHAFRAKHAARLGPARRQHQSGD